MDHRLRRALARSLRFLPSVVAIAALPAHATAQLRPLTSIGSVAEDRWRLAQNAGRAPTDGFLIRTPSSTGVDSVTRGFARTRLFGIAPSVDIRYNDRLPLSLNDGAMWAGRGLNTLIRAGFGLELGRLTIIVAPELTTSQNQAFDIFVGREPGRSAWSSPWHLGKHSADLPLRFGNAPITLLSPGQSSATLRFGSLAVGASTENQWWGPGVRNALLLSNQAEGVPHLFLRSAHPLQTLGGDFEWRIIAGGLTESLYFDSDTTNDYRSLSGFAVTFRPAVQRNLTIGIARLVVAPAHGRGTILQGAANAITKWHPADDPVTRADSLAGDQLISLFGRWLFPDDRFELYAEWAKSDLPRSLREINIAPQNSQGYTLGTQWALPTGSRGAFIRMQAEATVTDQTTVFANHPPADFYTGRTAAQGFTQRGQVLGASVGPGGQSQWLAADYLLPDWSIGLMLQRIRWEDDALYRQPLPNFFRHDVTLLAGLRGTVRTKLYDFSASIATNRRLSYLFQDGAANPEGRRTIDVPNLSLTFSAAPR
jgi:hypothetical protein